eukprot:CAMPEP_0117648824 /NCGR_PEP_ID=MMETSP0804-20121206/626_1 /TAXON_ID=1074897 /ORGANISM="Tetraselmis astigmatica, Strain CCMP880" /LENGTH=52 /DNA_ID=CAMNT_0005454483 /DNA_START=450 /DNA_END=608 /DNA_ORIENTATION=-
MACEDQYVPPPAGIAGVLIIIAAVVLQSLRPALSKAIMAYIRSQGIAQRQNA